MSNTFFFFCLQYFPGRPIVMNLLKSVESRLNQSGDEISYDELKEKLDNTAQVGQTNQFKHFVSIS